MTKSFVFCLCCLTLLAYSNASDMLRKTEEEPIQLNYNNRKFSGICSEYNCYGGKCTDTSTCTCLKEFADFNKENPIACQYHRHMQLYTMLLESLIGCGIGHLALGRIASGVCKLLLALFGVIAKVVDKVMNKGDDDDDKKCCILVVVGKIAGAAYGIWWIVDLFLFGYRYYYDGNGVDINPW